MKIAAISDTHGIQFARPMVDLFIHGGDMTGWGTWKETAALGKRLGNDSYDAVLLVPGNHDNAFEQFPKAEQFPFAPNTHLLIDEAWEYEGRVFYGSPWSQTFEGVNPRCMAFMTTEEELRRRYLNMPAEVDVLITHTPPKGILDDNKGSVALREAIEKRKIGKHLFGHIHECGGTSLSEVQADGSVRDSYNVSAILEQLRTYARPPRVFDL
jgi:Icc-related predicted phosphoesterase